MFNVGIIMPAYNAEATVVPTIQRIPVDRLLDAGVSSSLYLVNDGSTDGTAENLEGTELDPRLSLTVLTHPSNMGYGAAQKTGLSASLDRGNEAHVLLHADGQYAPEELVQMLGPLRQGAGADITVGSKFKKGNVLRQGMPVSRMLGIRLLDLVENLAFGLRGLEYHSGYMAYSTAALKRIRFGQLTDGFHFDGEMVLSGSKSGMKVVLVPISTCYSLETSSLNTWPYLREVLSTVLKYRKGLYWFQ